MAKSHTFYQCCACAAFVVMRDHDRPPVGWIDEMVEAAGVNHRERVTACPECSPKVLKDIERIKLRNIEYWSSYSLDADEHYNGPR